MGHHGLQKKIFRELPGGPGVKDFASQSRSVGLIPGQGNKTLNALRPKNQQVNNRSNIVTNSIKTVKMVHIINKTLNKRQHSNGMGCAATLLT